MTTYPGCVRAAASASRSCCLDATVNRRPSAWSCGGGGGMEGGGAVAALPMAWWLPCPAELPCHTRSTCQPTGGWGSRLTWERAGVEQSAAGAALQPEAAHLLVLQGAIRLEKDGIKGGQLLPRRCCGCGAGWEHHP